MRPLQFLADESCDFIVVRALREAGFDVTAIAELTPRAGDPIVLDMALNGQRIVLTEDKDFGQLVVAQRLPSAGVILIRFPNQFRSEFGEVLLRAWCQGAAYSRRGSS